MLLVGCTHLPMTIPHPGTGRGGPSYPGGYPTPQTGHPPHPGNPSSPQKPVRPASEPETSKQRMPPPPRINYATFLGQTSDHCAGTLHVLRKDARWIPMPVNQWTAIQIANIPSTGSYWHWKCNNQPQRRSRGAASFRERVTALQIYHDASTDVVTWRCYGLSPALSIPPGIYSGGPVSTQKPSTTDRSRGQKPTARDRAREILKPKLPPPTPKKPKFNPLFPFPLPS